MASNAKETSAMNIYQPYTYLIGWTAHNKWYYGVRAARNCNPSDLWVTYFTSSKHVKKFIEVYGKPDVILIRKIFDSSSKAYVWERKVLIRLKVIGNNKWLNRSTTIVHDRSGVPQPEEFKKFMSQNRKGRKHSEKTKQKIKESNTGKKRNQDTLSRMRVVRLGTTHSEMTKQKMSESHKGKSGISRPGIKNPMYGKVHTEETKRKISEKQKAYRKAIKMKEIN